jgi:hypothetical protein
MSHQKDEHFFSGADSWKACFYIKRKRDKPCLRLLTG